MTSFWEPMVGVGDYCFFWRWLLGVGIGDVKPYFGGKNFQTDYLGKISDLLADTDD